MESSNPSVAVVGSHYGYTLVSLPDVHVFHKGVAALAVVGYVTDYPWYVGLCKRRVRVAGIDIRYFELQCCPDGDM